MALINPLLFFNRLYPFSEIDARRIPNLYELVDESAARIMQNA